MMRIFSLQLLRVFQSSPSPGAGRCRLALWLHCVEWACVSILAQPGGRALPCPCRPIASPVHVSILAQPGGRALRQSADHADHFLEFQSSPSPGAGRCAPGAAGCLDPRSFNPRPARGPGAASLSYWPCRSTLPSFNPRPARGPGAADRAVIDNHRPRFRFNPRPARGPGAALRPNWP